jgi:hypothetical protein
MNEMDRSVSGGRLNRSFQAVVCAAGFALTGCSAQMPEGAIVLTQTPAVRVELPQAGTILDNRYPLGTRILLAKPPFRPSDLTVLSEGLVAAGVAVISPDGQRVLFAGKTDPAAAWQIYERSLAGGKPKRITSLTGGAMDPAVMANGDIVFSSPVPAGGELWKTETPSALYAQAPGGQPRRLTFGSKPAVEPTVLADGRILFVSSAPGEKCCDPAPHLSLFTINNDGTELTPFALDHDGAPLVHRPRELADGRVAFVAGDQERESRPETVRKARPFASRGPLWSFPCRGCRSIEPDGERMLLACLDTPGLVGRSMASSVAVFRIAADARAAGDPLFHDPVWNDIEAVPVRSRPSPMGHVSAIMAEKRTGTILCLNANFTHQTKTATQVPPKAQRVRVLAARTGSRPLVLGEVPVQEDGSFMAEVPADMPLGFETLDAAGAVLQRLAPGLWVRPGENRSCIGCHEPYNRSPRNLRPLAATTPVPALVAPAQAVALGGRP